jgi:hypothetical protein
VDGASAAIGFARDGRGVIGTFENWLTPYLESGELQPVLHDGWPEFEGPQLYFSSRFTAAPLRAFIELVKEEQNATRGSLLAAAPGKLLNAQYNVFEHSSHCGGLALAPHGCNRRDW